MEEQQRVVDKLNMMHDILQRASEYYHLSFYLHHGNNIEERKLAYYHPTIRYLAHTTFRDCVIELYKLFSKGTDNDIYSFCKIFNVLESTKTFKDKVSNMDIKRFKSIIDANAIIINDIYELRCNLYAHKGDPKKFDIDKVDVSFEAIDSLIKVALDILNELNLKLFNSEYNIQSIFTRNLDILESMIYYRNSTREKRSNDILSLYKK